MRPQTQPQLQQFPQHTPFQDSPQQQIPFNPHMNTARNALLQNFNRPYELIFPQNQPTAAFTNKQQGPSPQQPPREMQSASSADIFSSPNLQGDVLRRPSPQHIQQGMMQPQQNQPAAQTMLSMFNGRPPAEQIMHLRNAIRNLENAIATQKATLTDTDPMMKARHIALLMSKKESLVKVLNNVIATMCVFLCLQFVHVC
jgi:hypothetical protein